MTPPNQLEQYADQESPLSHSSSKTDEVGELWQRIHVDLVEWMTEGTHPYQIPRADHG